MKLSDVFKAKFMISQHTPESASVTFSLLNRESKIITDDSLRKTFHRKFYGLISADNFFSFSDPKSGMPRRTVSNYGDNELVTFQKSKVKSSLKAGKLAASRDKDLSHIEIELMI